MICVVGINHKTSPVEHLEKLARHPAPKVLSRLKSAGLSEAVVLSTCNRFEVYGPSGADPASHPTLGGFLEELAGLALPGRLELEGEAAVRHLFEVASGLDSLVLGETEVLGQVRRAYEEAAAAGVTGRATNLAFQRALYVGKLVRAQTGISRGRTSVASVAVELARRIFGDLRGRRVLVLGAGKMAELTARHILESREVELVLANRTWEKAEGLARELQCRAVPWEGFPEAMERSDVVLTSTGSDRPILTSSGVERILRARNRRPLFLIDIAMPRDVEEQAGSLENVYLYTLQDLQGIVEENVARRSSTVESARALLEAQVREFFSKHEAQTRNEGIGARSGAV